MMELLFMNDLECGCLVSLRFLVVWSSKVVVIVLYMNMVEEEFRWFILYLDLLISIY